MKKLTFVSKLLSFLSPKKIVEVSKRRLIYLDIIKNPEKWKLYYFGDSEYKLTKLEKQKNLFKNAINIVSIKKSKKNPEGLIRIHWSLKSKYTIGFNPNELNQILKIFLKKKEILDHTKIQELNSW